MTSLSNGRPAPIEGRGGGGGGGGGGGNTVESTW